MQLRLSCRSCCWASAVGLGYSPPRGMWLLLPAPVKPPRPLLQLLLEAVDTDLLPGHAGGQSASMISSSGSKPGLSRLHACLDGGDGVPETPPRPRSRCWMFSISMPSLESSVWGDLSAWPCGDCCALTRDELMVRSVSCYCLSGATHLHYFPQLKTRGESFSWGFTDQLTQETSVITRGIGRSIGRRACSPDELFSVPSERRISLQQNRTKSSNNAPRSKCL